MVVLCSFSSTTGLDACLGHLIVLPYLCPTEFLLTLASPSYSHNRPIFCENCSSVFFLLLHIFALPEKIATALNYHNLTIPSINSMSSLPAAWRSAFSEADEGTFESEKLLGQADADSYLVRDELEFVRPRPSRWSQAGRWALRFLMMLLIGWSLFDVTCHLWSTFHVSKRSSCSCGNSIEEAKSLNCKYDTLASAWLPPACRDEELTAEFDRAGPGPDGSWLYYTDLNKSGTYSIDEVAALADRPVYYYNTKEWHIAHCTYSWRKAVRARSTGVTLELRADTEGHVKHCEAMIRNPYPLDAVIVVSAVTLDADWEVLRKMHPMHPENSAVRQTCHRSLIARLTLQIQVMHPDSMHPKNMHPDNMHPESMHPDSMHLDNMHPESMHPDNMHPESMHPDSMHPDNMHPESMHPESIHPENMHPDSMHPDSMHPESMHPDSMHPNNMHPDSMH